MAIWKRQTDGKTTKNYWGAYTHPNTGKRIRVSLKTNDRSAAETVLGELQRRAARDTRG